MMQEFIVGLIVAYAACAVAMRYLPKRIRAAAREALANLFRRLGWNAAAVRLENARRAASCADGCGSCGGCGTTKDAVSPDVLRSTARQRSR
jgi:hypothetical protein